MFKFNLDADIESIPFLVYMEDKEKEACCRREQESNGSDICHKEESAN